MSLNFARGLRIATEMTMEPVVGQTKLANGVVDGLVSKVKGVDMMRAATHGGTAGAIAAVATHAPHIHGMWNMGAEEAGHLAQQHGELTAKKAAGEALSTEEAAVHQKGEEYARMQTHLLPHASGHGFAPVHEQVMKNPMGLAKAVGEDVAKKAGVGFATGTAAHAVGQVAAMHLAENKAQNYVPHAVAAGVAGGYLLGNNA